MKAARYLVAAAALVALGACSGADTLTGPAQPPARHNTIGTPGSGGVAPSNGGNGSSANSTTAPADTTTRIGGTLGSGG